MSTQSDKRAKEDVNSFLFDDVLKSVDESEEIKIVSTHVSSNASTSLARIELINSRDLHANDDDDYAPETSWPQNIPKGDRVLQILNDPNSNEHPVWGKSTSEIVRSLTEEEISALQLHEEALEVPIRDVVLTRWRISTAIMTRPKDEEIITDDLQSMIQEADLALQKLDPKSAAPEDQELIKKHRNALSKQAFDLAEIAESHAKAKQRKKDQAEVEKKNQDFLRRQELKGQRGATDPEIVPTQTQKKRDKRMIFAMILVLLPSIGFHTIRLSQKPPKNIEKPKVSGGQVVGQLEGGPRIIKIDEKAKSTDVDQFKKTSAAEGKTLVELSRGYVIELPNHIAPSSAQKK